MNRSARRILIGVGAGFALLLLLLVLVPVLFAGKISDRVKVELNRTLLAKVDWSSAGLGFFHDFPNLTLTLDDFSILGIGKFQGDTLAAIPRFRIVVDLASAIRAGLGMRRVGLQLRRVLVVALVHALAEALDRGTDVLADVAQALGAEYQRDDGQHDQPVPDAETAHDRNTSVGDAVRHCRRAQAPDTVPVVGMDAATDPHPCGVVYSSSRSRKSTIAEGTSVTPPSKILRAVMPLP